MPAVTSRRPSPLQRRVLIVLAALDAKRPGPVATRDIERVLEQGGDAPVYGPNLRASCRRMEAAGWLRTLRATNMQLAVELTDAGRTLAAPLLADEQARVLAEQRATAVRSLPLVPRSQAEEADDRPVELDGRWHLACRGDCVIRLDGTTGLQLWRATGQVTRLSGDPLQVAIWLQACHDAGIAVRVQINESATPEEGTLNVNAPADRTDTWYRQLGVALRAEGITGLNEEIRQAGDPQAGRYATCRRRRACCTFCATVRRHYRSRRPAMRMTRKPRWLTCWPARGSPPTRCRSCSGTASAGR